MNGTDSDLILHSEDFPFWMGSFWGLFPSDFISFLGSIEGSMDSMLPGEGEGSEMEEFPADSLNYSCSE